MINFLKTIFKEKTYSETYSKFLNNPKKLTEKLNANRGKVAVKDNYIDLTDQITERNKSMRLIREMQASISAKKGHKTRKFIEERKRIKNLTNKILTEAVRKKNET